MIWVNTKCGSMLIWWFPVNINLTYITCMCLCDSLDVLENYILNWKYCIDLCQIPENTTRWPNAWKMLAQRRRRWFNINTALGQRLVFAGIHLYIGHNVELNWTNWNISLIFQYIYDVHMRAVHSRQSVNLHSRSGQCCDWQLSLCMVDTRAR